MSKLFSIRTKSSYSLKNYNSLSKYEHKKAQKENDDFNKQLDGYRPKKKNRKS